MTVFSERARNGARMRWCGSQRYIGLRGKGGKTDGMP